MSKDEKSGSAAASAAPKSALVQACVWTGDDSGQLKIGEEDGASDVTFTKGGKKLTADLIGPRLFEGFRFTPSDPQSDDVVARPSNDYFVGPLLGLKVECFDGVRAFGFHIKSYDSKANRASFEVIMKLRPLPSKTGSVTDTNAHEAREVHTIEARGRFIGLISKHADIAWVLVSNQSARVPLVVGTFKYCFTELPPVALPQGVGKYELTTQYSKYVGEEAMELGRAATSLPTVKRPLRCMAAVAFVHVTKEDSGDPETGSGFRVSPTLFLTNNHVIRTFTEATTARIFFGLDGLDDDRDRFKRNDQPLTSLLALRAASSDEWECDPTAFFVTVDDRTDEANQPDFTLVAIKRAAATANASATSPMLPTATTLASLTSSGSGMSPTATSPASTSLGSTGSPAAMVVSFSGASPVMAIASSLKASVGSVGSGGSAGSAAAEPLPCIPFAPQKLANKDSVLIVIGHPNSLVKRISVGSQSAAAHDTTGLLKYNTETDVGNSGGPVLNASWQLVALHRRTVVDPSKDPTGSTKKPVNQGVLVAKILDYLLTNATMKNKLKTATALALLLELEYFTDVNAKQTAQTFFAHVK